MTGRSKGRARSPWLPVALVMGAIVTAVDAYLLERSKGFFTGGFLSTEHLDSTAERGGFLAVSLASDAAFVGLVMALVFPLVRALRLSRTVSWALAAGAGCAPLAVADVVRYELDRYLGDAFDLSLMFDLAGRSPSEVVAVAWSHVWLPVFLTLGVLVGAAGLVAYRWRTRPAHRSDPAGWGPGWKLPALVFLAVGVAASGARVYSPLLDDALRRKPSVDWPGRAVDLATDLDSDGYGMLSRPRDPAPLDGRVHPYAIDMPGNGIDENGVGGDMAPTLPPYVEPDTGPGVWRSRRHILLILLESVRADVVGARWHGRPVTPELDALAAGGLRSQNAWSHNGYTVQSRHHVFTGSLANLHGGTSLIDDFKANGYRVGYVSGQDDSFGSAALDVGRARADYTYTARDEPHRRYTTFSTPGSLAVPFDVVEEKAREFLRRNDGRPVFLYVNFHDTHFPYQHRGVQPLLNDVRVPQHEIGPENRAALVDMYLNTVANVDAAIGRLVAAARETLDGDVGVIVLSDHGESLYDEGFLGHGYALNDVQTRIPLIVHNVPLRVDEPWAQRQLRPALRAALLDDEGGGASPTLGERAPDEPVFQYLGGMSRSRQIGWRTENGTVLYDIRNRKASVEPELWISPSAVVGPSRVLFDDLIAFWERVRLAIHRHRRQTHAAVGQES